MSCDCKVTAAEQAPAIRVCADVANTRVLAGAAFTVSFWVTVEENAPLPATVIVGEAALVSL